MLKIMLVVLGFSQTLFAGGFVEPYLGMSFLGELENRVSNPGDISNVPVTIGARVGFVRMGLGVGLDYAMTRKIKFDNTSDDGDMQELGVIVGYSLPVLVKFYAGYVFTGNMDLGSDEYKALRGIKLGAGFKPMPMLNINLEMKSYDFNKFSGGITGQNSRADIRLWTLSVSAPINFF